MQPLTTNQSILTPTIASQILSAMPEPKGIDGKIFYIPNLEQYFIADGRIYLYWDDCSSDWLLWMNVADLTNVDSLCIWTTDQIEAMAKHIDEQQKFISMMMHVVPSVEPDIESYWQFVYESLITGHNEHRIQDQHKFMFEAFKYMSQAA